MLRNQSHEPFVDGPSEHPVFLVLVQNDGWLIKANGFVVCLRQHGPAHKNLLLRVEREVVILLYFQELCKKFFGGIGHAGVSFQVHESHRGERGCQ